MPFFGDLHRELLGKAVATHGPWWALGFLQRTFAPLTGPWRVLVFAAMMTVLIVLVAWLAPKRRISSSRSSPPREPVDPDRTTVFERQPRSLEGTWRLLAVEGRSGGRIISTPFGRHPIGQLVYMADGRMNVMIMAADRAKFGSHGLRAGTGPQKAAAFDSFLAYGGRYERLEDRVVHHPEVASIPDFVGVPEERFVSLEGDRLILSTPPMLEDGRVRTFVIVWQRVRVPGDVAAAQNDNGRVPGAATMKMLRGR